ncbi:MAG: hypothetical protein P4L34_02310 [Paludibacter sp.]|nr:hypothetical protein [Paludibacter sp.]
MQLNIPLLEWVGYCGSVIVAVSLTMSSIKKLRWYNLIGAAVFSFYGFAIGAFPVGFLNLFIVVADLYYLYKMYSHLELFKAISVDVDDSYLDYFIDFYQREIKKVFPFFNKEKFKQGNENNTFAILLLRNASVAGVFIGTKNIHTLTVHLDFVTAEYRDLKPGDFIYKKNIELIKKQNITEIICNSKNKSHQRYLKKMGFEQTKNDYATFTKTI